MKKVILMTGSIIGLISCQKGDQMQANPSQPVQQVAYKDNGGSWTEFKIHGLGFWADDGIAINGKDFVCFMHTTICYEVIIHAPRNPKSQRTIEGQITDEGIATGDLEIHIDPSNDETMQLRSFEGGNIVVRNITDFYQKNGAGYKTIKFN